MWYLTWKPKHGFIEHYAHPSLCLSICPLFWIYANWALKVSIHELRNPKIGSLWMYQNCYLVYIVPNLCYSLCFMVMFWDTYFLTELSPSWQAANCAATHKLPSILWSLKVHYRVNKSPPLVPILSHIDPVHTIPSYLSKICFNIVHPPTSCSS
jgi:hypothetical protein